MEEYRILDNYEEPYCVRLENGFAEIWGRANIILDQNNPYTRLIWGPSPYTRTFIGSNREQTHDLGNSILLELPDNQILYVGSDIYTFTPDQLIIEYFSPIGNNYVPYPYATGPTNTYLMEERRIIPNNLLEPDTDPYIAYYRDGRGEPFETHDIETKADRLRNTIGYLAMIDQVGAQDQADAQDQPNTNELIVRLVNNAPL